MRLHNYKKILLFTFFIGFSGFLSAQDYLFGVKEITIEDGLPDREVFDIVQDQKGFIWLSTNEGISRYDGIQFKNYTSEELGIEDDAWCKLAVDARNNIWFYERTVLKEVKRMGVINSELDSIYTLENYTNRLTEKDILNINHSHFQPEKWYITTRQGRVFEYREDDKLHEVYRFGQPIFRDFFAFHQKPSGDILILEKNNVHEITNTETKKYSLPEIYRIKNIVQHKPTLIINTYQTNTENSYFQLKNGRFQPYLDDKLKGRTTGLMPMQGGYWAYFNNYNFIIEDENEQIAFQYQREEDNQFDQKLWAITTFKDRQGIYWLGTNNGLIKVTQQKNPFTKYLTGKSARGIYANANYLWIGTYDGNARFTKPNHTDFINFTNSLPQPYLKTPTTSFIRDHENKLWTGTSEQIILKFEDDLAEPTLYKLTHGRYFTIFQNPKTKRIWLGTSDGLFYLDKNQSKEVAFELPVSAQGLAIRQFYQNAKGIWMVTSKGLFLMDAQTEKIIEYFNTENGFPFDNFNHLHESKNGIFWLATKGGGLLKWDIEKNNFEQFTKAQGLSDNVLYAVYEDDYDNLWLPSNYGLMRFGKHSHEVKLYLPQDGIAHQEFNTFSHYQAKDGTLYFGGLNGVTSFHPKEIQASLAYTPPLYITKVNILNNNNNDFTNITNRFTKQKRLVLKPSDQVLELELALLNFNSQGNNQYAYQVEGHQNNWIYTSDNKISILNLPYGKYTLHLKARGETDWEYSELSIPLTVLKPFYLQWWFIILMVALVAGIVRWRIWQLEKDKEHLELEVQKRTRKISQANEVITAQAEELKALDKAKTKFFSYISHEFRTPLTLIIGPLKQFLEEPPPPSIFKRRTKGIIKNAEQLLNLINQLLDLSKMESGNMEIETSKGDIIAYTKELVDRIRPMADEKKQVLHFVSSEADWITYFDKDKWDKIIYNLLSNAIKYTNKGKLIQVNLMKSTMQSKDQIQLTVKDTGIGIEQNKLNEIFKPYFRSKGSNVSKRVGVGIGLTLVKEMVEAQNGVIQVVSKPDVGTSFKITLPELEQQDNFLTLENTPEVLLPTTIGMEAFSEEERAIQEKKRKLELLIIEDNAEMRDYMRYCIDDELYNITEASNGEEGIQKAMTMIPDLILSDVMMPKKDGFEVVKAIRSSLTTSHIPIILLTVKSSLESRLEGLQHGADVYLTKPFSPVELRLRIQKLIEIRQLLQLRLADGQESLKDNTFQKEDKFIEELRTYIISNINAPNLTGNEIGKHFGMSRVHLYRKLKALTDSSISEFVLEIRLQKALELIKLGELRMSEVAYDVGFTSPSYFTKVFKVL